jgi:sugar O-acyltransferase (sialic acid O-acetyltransferase NeuD family)
MGTGGFGRETLTCLIDQCKASGHNYKDFALFVVDDAYYTSTEIMGIPVIRTSEFGVDTGSVVVAIGDPDTRHKIATGLPAKTTFGQVIHPTAVISDWVDIGPGSIVTAGCVLTCNITIGSHAHINLLTTIGHDCKIGDYFTTAPGANISGNCTFGHSIYLGSNVVVKQGINICSNVTIGMGGVVVKDITEPGVYVGNPVRKLR